MCTTTVIATGIDEKNKDVGRTAASRIKSASASLSSPGTASKLQAPILMGANPAAARLQSGRGTNVGTGAIPASAINNLAKNPQQPKREPKQKVDSGSLKIPDFLQRSKD